ncbi:hypothetical protein FQN54_000698 [Arachnomyces sp. PD_36]|nr:hypothetical protein FQN54_000698 [Arachnomyces sp. PD_36]
MHNSSIDKAECGTTAPLPSNQQPMPKKRNTFRWKTLILAVFVTIVCALTLSKHVPLSLSPGRAIRDITSRADATELMNVFQPYKPVRVEPDEKKEGACKKEVVLMKHRFGFSYGHPFVGSYEPPECDFNSVTINLTVTSKGRQFDRLGLMYLGDIEVFRTSTAEPTTDGIVWTYIKQMSQYNSLWKEKQKLIFDLGNLIDDTYTAPFDVTLTASFSWVSKPATTAKTILPISAQKARKDSPSAFNVPADNATVSHKIPVDTSRAVVSISACGQATEEFWYSNVLSKDKFAFNETTGELNGFSSFREVQLLIDGDLAGVVWPSPVVFTGGIAPGFWRPVVDAEAFDLREPEIDISPFLPILTDGKPHTFEIIVAGLEDKKDGSLGLSKSVGSYWVVTGKIFLYGDGDKKDQPKGEAEKDCKPEITAVEPIFTMTRYLGKDKNDKNDYLSYFLSASRSITVKSCHSKWSQSLSYTNTALVDNKGVTQFNDQYTSSGYTVSLPGKKDSTMTASYPITVNSSYAIHDNGFTIDATLNRGLSIVSDGDPTISTYTLSAGPSDLDARMHGTASYTADGEGGSSSSGDTTHYFRETSGGEKYRREVRAVNGTIVSDGPNGEDVDAAPNQSHCLDKSFARDSVRSFLGRGPGSGCKSEGDKEKPVKENSGKGGSGKEEGSGKENSGKGKSGKDD